VALSMMLLLFGCVLVIAVFVVLAVGVILIAKSGERDVVSTARQDWINRRSEQDQDRDS